MTFFLLTLPLVLMIFSYPHSLAMYQHQLQIIKIEYNIFEVKKLLVQIDLHIGIMSTAYIFLLCVINGVNLKMQW